ncbi:MAG: MFS transporter [Candidatus Mesenet longicola]|uniref:MFS transporter n=1 Tax=Candidatus Mesenet longicola TaxID=1892558 RepID=A0A8J3HS28_9RICK|nr:MAG: MFS transporter [Candidatus Mesenet longicola]
MLFIDLINFISNEFFPKVGVYQNLFKLFGIFALSTIAKPFGAFIFGYIGDRYGRRVSLFISILLISIPSSFISFIPGYEKIGIFASISIILIRIMQGIAFGAEQGSPIYFIEHSADKKNLGMFYGIVGLGKSLGISLAAITIILCKKNTDFNTWGWRLPFVLCFVLGLISAFSRYKLKETLAYQINKSKDNLSKTPISELIKNYKNTLILAIFICMPINLISGFMTFFRALTKERIMHIYATTFVNEITLIIGSILIQIAAIIFGILSDKIGREKVAISCIIVSMLMCCSMLFIAHHCNSYLIISLSVMTLSVIEAGISPLSITVSELFSTKVRFSGINLSRNISSALFEGLTPIICTWFIIKFTGAAGLYIVLCLLIGIIAILKIKPQDKKFDW